jgi:hypothetical protein
MMPHNSSKSAATIEETSMKQYLSLIIQIVAPIVVGTLMKEVVIPALSNTLLPALFAYRNQSIDRISAD